MKKKKLSKNSVLNLNATSNSDDQNAKPKPNIIALNYSILGVYITLLCEKCDCTFKSYQPPVAGVAIEHHECPKCKSIIKIFPEDFEIALNNILPTKDFHNVKHLILEASKIAESWYRTEPFSQILEHRGLNLGEPTELGLFSDITQGLELAQSIKEEK